MNIPTRIYDGAEMTLETIVSGFQNFYYNAEAICRVVSYGIFSPQPHIVREALFKCYYANYPETDTEIISYFVPSRRLFAHFTFLFFKDFMSLCAKAYPIFVLNILPYTNSVSINRFQQRHYALNLLGVPLMYYSKYFILLLFPSPLLFAVNVYPNQISWGVLFGCRRSVTVAAIVTHKGISFFENYGNGFHLERTARWSRIRLINNKNVPIKDVVAVDVRNHYFKRFYFACETPESMYKLLSDLQSQYLVTRIQTYR
eukprot:snap_masked-scaffold_33-processed-gene-0.19-mRNA-1 protein AED:1.00 eAED:1.00 QI:0/-1/0/0/-1/1/1/0/257